MTVEAAKVKARQAIRRHRPDEPERRRLFTRLQCNDFASDPWLSRLMRHYWRRGHNHTHNQIIVRSDDYTTFQLGGHAWIKIPGLERSQRIVIPLSTTVEPTGTLRIILRDGQVEVHYAIEWELTKDCGGKIMVVLVNSAYTSQMDSRHGVLLERRVGDAFYCFDGVVLPADENAARNVLARLFDPEIDRWPPYQKVKSILLERTERHRLGLLNQDSSCASVDASTESEMPEQLCLSF